MDNLTVYQEQNRTFWTCSRSVNAVHDALNAVLLFISFPATFVVIVTLLSRVYRTRSLSSAELFLLQINLANVCLFLFNMMTFLMLLRVGNVSWVLYTVVFIPTVTARPVFLLAMCVIFYLAVARPLTYKTIKTWRHWEWLVITSGWSYALLMAVAIILLRINVFVIVFAALFYAAVLPSMFVNIATLRALSSGRPGSAGQASDPAKRKAFRIILAILLLLLVYCIPRVYYIVYPFFVQTDWWRFHCAEGPVIMILPKLSEVLMPAIFLYSLQKLGVSSQAEASH